MPYGTDNFEVEEVGNRACERAYKTGAKVLLLPTIPYGVNTNHLKVPGALACSVTPSTLLHLLTDLVDSLERQGIRKLVLLNGHGGNELKPLMRELRHRRQGPAADGCSRRTSRRLSRGAGCHSNGRAVSVLGIHHKYTKDTKHIQKKNCLGGSAMKCLPISLAPLAFSLFAATAGSSA